MTNSNKKEAYKVLEDVLKRAQGHSIQNPEFKALLAEAEKARLRLWSDVSSEIERERQEQQRLQAEARQRAEEARRRQEEERRLAEAKEQLKKKYRNAPQSAKNALNAIKKLEALTEVGVNYANYSQAVGVAWGDVKIFIESSEGKEFPELCRLFAEAIAEHKKAIDFWKLSIEARITDPPPVQVYWLTASVKLKAADQLLNQ